MRKLAAISLLLLCLGLSSGCGRKLEATAARTLMHQVRHAWLTTVVAGEFETSVRVQGQTLTAEARLHRGADVAVTEYLSGRYQGWKIVEQDGLVWRVDPQGQPRAAQGPGASSRLGLPAGERDLSVRRLMTWRRVAGRPTVRYLVRPPGRTKARLVLDLDRQSSFPLASVRYDTQGQLLSSTVFQTAAFGGEPPQQRKVPAVARARGDQGRIVKTKTVTEAELREVLGGELLKPTHLPRGFAQTGAYLSQSPRGILAELRYSDGLRVITLLQVDLSQARAPRTERESDLPGGRPRSPERVEASAPDRDPRPGQTREPGHDARAEAKAGQRDPGQRGLRQALRSRLRGQALHERRGDRLIVLAGDLTGEELQQVMDSIPARK